MVKTRHKMKARITTIEGLASLMVGEFTDLRSEMNTRFDEMGLRFEKLEKGIEEAEKRIAALEMKVSGLYRLLEEQKLQRLDVTSMYERLARLEQKVFGK